MSDLTPSPDPTLQPDPNQGFVKRPLEEPILDNRFQNRILTATPTATASSGFKSFYQSNKFYIFAMIGGLVLIAILAYFAFRKNAPPVAQEAKVQITIDAPETVPSGGEVVYKITINNQDTQKLVGMELELTYPQGVNYINSSPAANNLSGTTYKVPDLLAGQNAAVIVKTKATGNVNDTKTLTARLRYSLSNFNSEFVKEQHFDVHLVASDIQIQLTGPTSTNGGQIVVYTIAYKNNSGDDLTHARVRITYPDGFTFASANPPADLGNNSWNIDALAKGAEGTIAVQGAFTSVNPGEAKTATADFMILGTNGQYFVQNSSPFTIGIATQPLLVTQALDQNNANNIVNPGDTINITVKYQNNAAVSAKGVNISLSLDSKSLDLNSIQAEGAQINNGTLTWNAASVSQLETLAPNESGTLRFSVNVKNPATKDSSKNLNVVSHVKIKSDEYQDYFPGNDLTLKISSPSSITSSLDYVDGQLPPQVGKNTTYRVTLTLGNATNDFSDTIVTVFIPLGAGAFDKSTLSDPSKATYDPSTGKLTWNVGTLAGHTGQFSQAKTLTFNLRLNPSSSQVGKSPTLVKTITMDAKDIYTGQTVHNVTDDITTGSVSGDNNYSNGQVIQ